MFNLDSYIQITDPTILTDVVKTFQYNQKEGVRVIAPLVKQHSTSWSNFWGALSSDGWYARSQDYLNIVHGDIDGLFKGLGEVIRFDLLKIYQPPTSTKPCSIVPYIANCYMIEKSAIQELYAKSHDPWQYGKLETDMSFAFRLREFGIFMHVLTKSENYDSYVKDPVHYGRILVINDVKTDVLKPDLWQMESNPLDFEELYINPDLVQMIREFDWGKGKKMELEHPCNEVAQFPFVTRKFGKDIIDMMEHNGQWSGAKHEDSRISGGYENVPTDDIHFNQVGWEKEWKEMIRKYIKPIVYSDYEGYTTNCDSHMMFVVRYHLGGQKYLTPHNDASTWTLTVALNERHVDFIGGGTYFTRYKCLASPDLVGGGFIFPGRLTHNHSGQELKSGRRYIIVSFMDP